MNKKITKNLLKNKFCCNCKHVVIGKDKKTNKEILMCWRNFMKKHPKINTCIFWEIRNSLCENTVVKYL
jgi:hypothetical protein